jgi:cytoskeletal protein CcmA (bactofilin family)
MKHVLVLLWMLCSAGLAAAQERTEPGFAERRVGGDLFVGGGSVAVSEPVRGDLFAGAGSIDVDAAVSGDAVLAGGKVRLSAEVSRNAYAGGGQVNLLAKVGGNARLAGGQVELAPKSEVAGNLSVAGGQVRLLGTIGGHVQAAGGRLLIDGPVGGDVIATSGRVVLGPNARIAGKLRHRSGELERDAAAQVSGGVEPLLPRLRRGEKASAAEPAAAAPRERGWAFPVGLWTVGLMLLAALLLAMAPVASTHVTRTWREKIGSSLLAGFALLVCVPVAVLLFAITIIGIPVAIALLASYLTLIAIAYVASAVGAGDWALQRWRQADAAKLGWRIGAACVALVVLALLTSLPWLSALVTFFAVIAGLGAIVLAVFGRSPRLAA